MLKGLTYGRNPLAFPVGRQAGVDRSHIACKGNPPLISLVANPTGAATTGFAFRRLDSPGVGTVNGTSGFTGGVNLVGPYAGFAAGASVTNYISYPSPKSGTLTAITLACIFTPITSPGSSNDDPIMGTSTTAFGGNGLELKTSSNTVELYDGGVGGAVTSGINLTLNVPYFIVASCALGGASQNFVVLNLKTGQIKTAHTTTTYNNQTQGSSWAFGGFATSTFGSGSGGQIGAALIAVNGGLLSIPELLMWAADPWSFWYPDRSFAVSPFFMSQAPQGAVTIDVPPHWRGITFPPQWSPLAQLLRNTAQDTSSSAVETNVHTVFKTLPPQWVRNPILLLNTAQDFSSSAVETNPHWKGIQWPPQWAINKPLFRVTAQDFSASAVETNVHTTFKTWPPQWQPLVKLRQNDPQDFSSSAVETNVHTVFRTWPLQWSLALRENSDPNSSTPVQPETNVHFIPRTYPPQWAPLKNLQNTAQDFSSSAVETNVHTIFRTWPYQWAQTKGLITAPDTSESGIIQPETNVFFVPRTYSPQWAPLKNLQNTAQDFSSSAVETNVHTAFRTWSPQWVMLLRTQNTAQDFSSSAVETNPHWIGKPWPIQWAPAIALRTAPATDVPAITFDTPPHTVFRTWLPQWLINLPLLHGTAQDFSSTAVETNVHFIPHTWPPQWNLQASLKQGTAQDFSTTPPAFVEIYENQFFSAFARIGAIGRNP